MFTEALATSLKLASVPSTTRPERPGTPVGARSRQPAVAPCGAREGAVAFRPVRSTAPRRPPALNG